MGVCPWWWEISTRAFQAAFADADRAWKNWLDSVKGVRAGRRVGYPRFKKRGRTRDAFRLCHDVKKPAIRVATYRRLRLGPFGEVRSHNSAKRLSRQVDRGEAVVQSVSVSRHGHRWYASVLCKVTAPSPQRPSRQQRARGTVGVDVGVHVLAALSKPLNDQDPASRFITNPRLLKAAAHRLAKAQRALSRTQKGSARRDKARRHVARLHHEVAVRRDTALHQLTKRLATRFATVAVEDPYVPGMTRSARGTLDNPGRNVRQKASLNSALLDSAPGELRHQVTYKSNWYGSHTAVLHRKWPSSKTCSACGWRHPSLTLADSSTAPPAVCASTATSTPPTTSSGTPRLPLEQGRRPWRERKSCRPPGRKADPQKTGRPGPGRATPEEQSSGHPHSARHHRPSRAPQNK